MSTDQLPPRAKHAHYLEAYMITFEFDTEEKLPVDFKDLIYRRPDTGLWKPLRDIEYFKSYEFDPDFGDLEWENGMSFAADRIYELAKDQEMDRQAAAEEKPKSKRGGARPGAGRKPKPSEEKRVVVNFRVKKGALERLTDLAWKLGKDENQVLEEGIEVLEKHFQKKKASKKTTPAKRATSFKKGSRMQAEAIEVSIEPRSNKLHQKTKIGRNSTSGQFVTIKKKQKQKA